MEEFGRELQALKEASGCSLAEIMRLGEIWSEKHPARAVKFKKPSLSEWFNGKSVPSDPQVLRALVEVLEPLAERRDPGRPRKGVEEWERLRRSAERERRQGMGVPRGTAGDAHVRGARTRRSGSGEEGGRVAAGQPQDASSENIPGTESGNGAVAAGDAAKAARLLTALPPYEPWLRTLRAKPMDRVHTSVDDAFTLACEELRAEVVGFIDPALHQAYTVVEETAMALELKLEGMHGPDPGSPWRVLTNYVPQRRQQLDGLHAARDRFDTAYRALLDVLNRHGMLPQPDRPVPSPSEAPDTGPGKAGTDDGAVARADTALLALRRALESQVPLDGFDSDLVIGPGASGDELEWEEMCDPALRRRRAYRGALWEVREAFDGLAPYLLLVLGPDPTREDLARADERVRRLRTQHMQP
ncbi:helix-turn-helix domain-containing protein [Streptomyces rubellomurinus]|uniref:Uncharacterized protein n=1 Tax=Streptomyces rubellomurinus (strain ATCC 31215) TaxID=359131 RepID=A0A0F2T9H9_STRR3|nr:helix-turn-helix transcriptional regulator [Streptomyces rubellomurinus]KJS58412.1 hypothetical protein VM95_33405 [Streptomyces rubellomurinus]